ncbi:MAG TPA: 2Fe-2S iron-sulfur cluster-binding protein [Stellaceae bacterium]|nr:2Fe-2S iron-sulfur cluster-binding protein [Stellaceae bacterium]
MNSRTATLRVRRGTSDDPAPRYDEFAVPFEEGDTVLDALIWIRAHRDPSLALRYSCINANVCKECTIAINGRVAYACTTRLHAESATVLEPLPGKKLLRDLVSDTRPPREKLD